MLVAQSEVTDRLGTAIRAIVLDGQVIAATERTAPSEEWRSNIARGGTQRPVTLAPNEVEICEHAARVVGLGFAGVDIVRSSSGPLVLEVNAAPGFTSMSPHTTTDIAGRVIASVLGRA